MTELAHKSENRKKLDLLALGFTAQEAEYLKTLHWTMSMHISAGDGNTLNHVIEALGIVRSVYTPKITKHKHDCYGEFGTPRVVYYVDGEGKVASMAEALACVREKHYDRIVKAMRAAGFEPKSLPDAPSATPRLQGSK